MSNRIRHVNRATESADSIQMQPPKIKHWPCWRVIYWFVVFIVVTLLCVGLFFALKSERGQCLSHDVRCE